MRNLAILLGVVVLLAGALGVAVLATGGAERLKPVVAVTFDTITAYPAERRVEVAGQLFLPSSVHCDTDCGVYLVDLVDSNRMIPLFIGMPPDGATPGPGQMGRLPQLYTFDDFRVRATAGASGYLGQDDAVRIVGHLCRTEGPKTIVCVVAEEIYPMEARP